MASLKQAADQLLHQSVYLAPVQEMEKMKRRPRNLLNVDRLS